MHRHRFWLPLPRRLYLLNTRSLVSSLISHGTVDCTDSWLASSLDTFHFVATSVAKLEIWDRRCMCIFARIPFPYVLSMIVRVNPIWQVTTISSNLFNHKIPRAHIKGGVSEVVITSEITYSMVKERSPWKILPENATVGQPCIHCEESW